MSTRTPHPTSHGLDLLTIEDLAGILHKSAAALYSLYARNKASLPARVSLPGVKRIYFRRCDVEAWIAGHVVQPEPQPKAEALARKRGRPTKAEQIQRQRNAH